jgi:hypothetical protein
MKKPGISLFTGLQEPGRTARKSTLEEHSAAANDTHFHSQLLRFINS